MPETDKPTNEAFERFRAFAQKIISVPKAEVDRRAKAEKSRKALRKAKA
jgi:hypothetical protein